MMMPQPIESIQVYMARLDERQIATNKTLEDLCNLLRGSPQHPGLVQRVGILESGFIRIENVLGQVLSRQECENAERKVERISEEKKLDEALEKKTVTWKWLVEKVGLLIGGGFITWFLFDVFPQIIILLGTHNP